LPNEPRWLSFETVIEINRTLVAVTGEQHFLRDQGLLECAIARPQNAFAYGEEDIVVLAARLMAGIAQAHAFKQGNKRTAFTSMRLFLRANGYDLGFDDSEAWANALVALIEHVSTEEDFIAAIRPLVVERPA
jgi:death-on-curing family protein